MIASKLLAAAVLCTCSLACAQNVVLSGHVQKVVLQPFGTRECPPPCPASSPTDPGGTQRVCISNAGGCQMMEVAVDRIYRGGSGERVRQFTSRIGEWGPSFPVTSKQIVVSEEAGNVFWSYATVRDGKIYVDPNKLHILGGASPAASSDGAWVALDEVLARREGQR